MTAGRPKGSKGTRYKRQFDDPHHLYVSCTKCTPEKASRTHGNCYSLDCICWHHPNWSALHAREAGLRTQPKPGEVGHKDFKVKESDRV